MAALYWRVKGQGKKAIDCLRQALHYAPHQMKVSGTQKVQISVSWSFPLFILRFQLAPLTLSQ